MNINAIAELLLTSPKVARKWADNMKLVPISLGVGRGRGYRWYKHEVMEALDGCRIKPKGKPGPKPKPVPLSVFDQPTAQLVAELSQTDTKIQ